MNAPRGRPAAVATGDGPFSTTLTVGRRVDDCDDGRQAASDAHLGGHARAYVIFQSTNWNVCLLSSSYAVVNLAIARCRTLNKSSGGPFPIFISLCPPSARSPSPHISYHYPRVRKRNNNSYEECSGPSGREAGERGRVTRTSHTNPCILQGSRTSTISPRDERTCRDVRGITLPPTEASSYIFIHLTSLYLPFCRERSCRSACRCNWSQCAMQARSAVTRLARPGLAHEDVGKVRDVTLWCPRSICNEKSRIRLAVERHVRKRATVVSVCDPFRDVQSDVSEAESAEAPNSEHDESSHEFLTFVVVVVAIGHRRRGLRVGDRGGQTSPNRNEPV
ncbi:hypothetical protein EVAR_19356_1 [Eumeta japonica]|uniref:Uncharacterized protein n=1 Tax=Eumeta variegata TaxID=151549 RepID=A0A4C1TRF5_EUMVA|nr:hypothetical protein EVAR_19356_1 [Eumeta japonica]